MPENPEFSLLSDEDMSIPIICIAQPDSVRVESESAAIRLRRREFLIIDSTLKI
jgi:hypothetical protein